MKTQFLKFTRIVMSVVFLCSTSFANTMESPYSSGKTFKIVPTKENKKSNAYIVFNVTEKKTVVFLACQNGVCKKILEQPISETQINEFSRKAVEESKKVQKKWHFYDVVKGAGVTHFGITLLVGLGVFIGEFGTLAGLASAANGALIYGLSPLLTGIPILMAATAAVGFEGGVALGAGMLIGMSTLTIAVLGGLAYATYKYYNPSEQPQELDPNSIHMNYTQDELIAIVKLFGQQVQKNSVMP